MQTTKISLGKSTDFYHHIRVVVLEVNLCLRTRRRAFGSFSVLTSVRSIIPFVHRVV
jgi:hypothetical protein